MKTPIKQNYNAHLFINQNHFKRIGLPWIEDGWDTPKSKNPNTDAPIIASGLDITQVIKHIQG